ncbi:MAG: hypothetical protein V4582_20275 [Pseudomonadota bacterium]
MDTPYIQTTRHRCAKIELEQVESVMQTTLCWLRTLEGHRDALRIEIALPPAPQPGAEGVATMKGPGFEFQMMMVTHWNYIDIFAGLLRTLWMKFPERRDSMAGAMGRYGTKRAYVARSPGDLFPGKSEAWALGHSKELIDGWFVDANLNLERMRRILPAAVAAAGLKWNDDVKVYWRRTRVAA